MIIFPAIDLFGGQAVRLFKGDYDRMTVYDKDPSAVAERFKAAGATHLHMVDLEGARSGGTPNMDTIRRVAGGSGLFVELGGGIRSLQTAEKYLNAGVSRVIFGTAAAKPGFAAEAVKEFGDKVAVGMDVKDGMVAVHGWTQSAGIKWRDFCAMMTDAGVSTLICTDISRDGAMQGANHDFYREISASFDFNVIASGGVSSLEDVASLAARNIYGAIIGKAYYTGAIDLAQAIELGGAK
ncbi:MAG: 1-(5-phosphoribosyl)-5-[Oscillospiraceae bacterium]|nr:1-(5-phosphoribosyl)-5-[(5-phosphoribosylamino)methylideneamino]imidazole-4-carboxamide isomerase [Oscillospiraceae bacterium]